MNLLRTALLPAALCLTMVANIRADDKKADGDKDKDGEKTITVHGVISDFTMIGETDVDETTGKAMTATATLVTVIGHPWMHEADHKDHAEATDKAKTDGKNHAEHHHHRMNLYVAALTPKTKVCEVMASGKEVALSDKDADYDDLEIGDRVELVITVKNMEKMMAAAKTDVDDKKKDGDDKKMTKHGRHRTYLGSAVQVKLMSDHMEGMHHDGKTEHKEDAK